MPRLFGTDWTRAELERLCAAPDRLFGIEHLEVTEGPARGQRIMRVEAGEGLSVELLPDRLCDIGAVWCGGVPFFWTGPNGAQPRPDAGTNTPLYGLLQTCGFDHFRQAETVEGVAYPQHGGMLHMPATITGAQTVWAGDDCTLRITAEARQFTLQQGALALTRTIEIPLGAREIHIADEVRVTAGPLPVMAMYHVNLGFPVARPGARMTLNGRDITGDALAADEITTRPSDGRSTVTLGPDEGPAFEMTYEAASFPVLQTLNNSAPGVGLICIEPASHDRRPRAELVQRGDLTASDVGAVHRYGATLRFRP